MFMADSDDEFGELDDTAFLDAATQYEQGNLPTFQPSPRASKRRKIAHRNERTGSIPSRKQRRKDQGAVAEGDRGGAPVSPALSARGDSPAIFSSPLAGSKTGAVENEDGARGEQDRPAWKKAKKEKQDRIHRPATVVEMPDIYSTQPPQQHSPPWKPRGAIWQKPLSSIGVHHPSAQSSKTNTVSQTIRIASPTRQSISTKPSSRQSHQIDIGNSPNWPATKSFSHEYDPVDELADLPSDAFESSSSSSPQKVDDVVLVSERRARLVAPQTGLRQTTLFGRQSTNGQIPSSQTNKRYSFVADLKAEPATHHKLNAEATRTWVYPVNIGTFREYQNNIVRYALYHNLLVALPTGLGKTFIAATVMLNWFRWTTDSQIVFVAPTKPLVAQQVEACFNIVGIPRSQTTMLTGSIQGGLRAEQWASKRVFFMTPQTLLNDLKSGIADPKKIVLLVVDEAHKATGSYAYVEVVKFLRRFNQSYRILALTATPGSDVESVQNVINGLDIARIEIRTENSLDIVNYVHQRKVEKHVFTNSDEMETCMDLYSTALQPLVNKIAGLNAFWSNDPKNLTPYGCNQARQRWAQEAGKQASAPMRAMVATIFGILGSLSHGMELLKYHGIGPFYTKMKEFRDAKTDSKSKYRKEIIENDAFKTLMVRLHTWVTNPSFVGHPKLEYLQQVILEHFVNAAEGHNVGGVPPSQTRIMVFANFRDSAEEIVRVLKRNEPMIRPRVFVGQASGKNSEGMNQKEQLNVIEQFKMGTFNTLVATSIGEEGLDIGEVDLIVCYDSKASPIRMLQRMGRTGRKREGKIILLQMKGKEENDSQRAKDSYEKMQELIAKGDHFAFHTDISRRILPHDVKPIEDRHVVEIPLENSQADFLPEPRKNGRAPKRPPKKFHMPDNVITGFVTAGRMDEEMAPKARPKKKAPEVPSDAELFTIPSLDTVLLDDVATKDLERRYQTVYGDDDAPVIGQVSLCKHPTRQHDLARTKYFPRPGHAARRFVDTVRRMHAVDDSRLQEFKNNFHHSDCESSPEDMVVESHSTQRKHRPMLLEEILGSDEPGSQSLPTTKHRFDEAPKAKVAKTAKSASRVKAPRGRPRKMNPTMTPPARQKSTKNDAKLKTPTYRMSELVEEAASSSPPPTDPQMRLATQGIDIGSDDTIGDDGVENSQAYRLDSDLRDFIADDNSDVEMSDSSLPAATAGAVGRGTQAVVEGARPRRKGRVEKIFTSDPTDDDVVVSSDSDDDVPVRGDLHAPKQTYTVSSASEVDQRDPDDGEPIVKPRKRLRRVVDDDEEE